MLRHVVRLAAATLAVAAAGVVVSSSAHAATCSRSTGVSVVVDFHQLRSGGAQAACDAGGAGEYAAAQFSDVGHTLTYVQNEPFVCQVDGLGSPQCARTPPADAYWSLWWSDGKSGRWTYASLGVTSLKVPAGGYVALSWQQGNAQVPPRVTPKAHSATSPTTAPTSHPTSSPSHPTHGASSVPTATTTTTPASPTTAPTTRSTAAEHRHPARSKTAEPHHRASQSSANHAGKQLGSVLAGGGSSGSGSGSGGLPAWVAPTAVVAVFTLGGGVALLRRKSRGGL